MRECIYCGRTLEKGEKCDCAVSVAKRKSRDDGASAADTAAHEKKQRNEKQTQRKREKARTKEPKRRAKPIFSAGTGMNPFANVWRLFLSFLRSPVETVMNPGEMSILETLIFVIGEGIISGLSYFAIVTGVGRGPFRLLGNIIGFRGAAGYEILLGWLTSAISGALSGVLMFFIYSGIFFLVNKYIFKQFGGYWQFARRFAFVAIPMSVIGAVGVILGFFSHTTFTVLMLSGICGTLLITYEILRAVWHSKSTTKTIYTMMLCVFIFLMAVMYLIKVL